MISGYLAEVNPLRFSLPESGRGEGAVPRASPSFGYQPILRRLWSADTPAVKAPHFLRRPQRDPFFDCLCSKHISPFCAIFVGLHTATSFACATMFPLSSGELLQALIPSRRGPLQLHSNFFTSACGFRRVNRGSHIGAHLGEDIPPGRWLQSLPHLGERSHLPNKQQRGKFSRGHGNLDILCGLSFDDHSQFSRKAASSWFTI